MLTERKYLMPIDAQMVNNLFRSNSVSEKCPACGQPNWRFGKDIVSLPYAQETSTQTPAPAPAIHATPTICNNCGYIRLFIDRED